MDTKENVRSFKSDVVDNLMILNNIKYSMPAELGIADSRTHQEDLFQRNEYSGGEMVLICQTGSAMVDPLDSWLSFYITATSVGGTGADFGIGSIANVFKEILLESRTGVDLCRVREAGLYIKTWQDWLHSPQWKATSGVAQGYSQKLGFGETGGTVAVLDGTIRYAIRLSDIAPLFKPIGNKLLPPHLMEGLRIRITLARGVEALVGTGASSELKYTITDPRITWGVIKLNDAFQRKLNETASTAGLTLLHKEVHQQQTSAAANQYDYDINKAVSRALKCVVIPRPTGKDVATAAADYYSSEVFRFSKVQARVGNVYYPQKPLETVDAGDFMEFYHYNSNAWRYLDDQSAPVVVPTALAGGYGSAVPENSKACHTVPLDMSSVTGLDGMTINNSRSLILNLSFTTADSRRIDSYLEYLRAIVVYTSNVVVRD